MVAALAPHPAERRRLARSSPAPDPHEVVLRPVGGGPAEAMIVTAGSRISSVRCWRMRRGRNGARPWRHAAAGGAGPIKCWN